MTSTVLRITKTRLFITTPYAHRPTFATGYAAGGVIGRYRYFHGTQMVCGYSDPSLGTKGTNSTKGTNESNENKENQHYTATESHAEGLLNTNHLAPPPLTNDEQRQANQKEPAAAGTETGNTFEELKEFARNTAKNTRAALKGKHQTQSQTQTVETEHKPNRFMSTFSNIKEKVTEVKEGTKQALKDVSNAAMKAAAAGKAEVEKDVNKVKAMAYAHGAKAETEGVIESTKDAAKDTYNTAKETLEKGAENLKSTAKGYVKGKASQAAESMKDSTAMPEAEGAIESTKNAAKDTYTSAKDTFENGTENLKSKAKGYANSMNEKASQAARSMKVSTEMSGSIPAATTNPRTDPASGANVEPRTDRPTRGTNMGSRSDM